MSEPHLAQQAQANLPARQLWGAHARGLAAAE